MVFGDDGSDWIEGGRQADVLQGDHGAPFQDDTRPGHDVIIGGPGDDDYDSEGGDDVMVSDPGIERNEGMLGYDWVTHHLDPDPANADMNFTGLLPPDVNNIRDRFDLVEGLSGWRFDDVLRGDSRLGPQLAGHELRNIPLIEGLEALLDPGVTQFTGGNIILGGDGSDILEGRGGDDLLDGDAWLGVRLSVRDAANPDVELRSANRMAELQADVFARRVDPGQIRIVREIVTPALGSTVDTAVFSDVRFNYDITANPDGSITVVHARPVPGAPADGTDRLRNIERLRFADQTVLAAAAANTPASGSVSVSDTTPTRGQVLTAVQAITDPDGFDPGSIVYNWQSSPDGIAWRTIAVGESFTPGATEVDLPLRVVATFVDNGGVAENVTSPPTTPVVGGDDLTPPTVPSGVTATGTSPTEITITWNESTDNVAVAGYRIFRDGSTTPVATVGSPPFVDSGLSPGTTHTYTVAAFDTAGNIADSAPAAGATLAPPAPIASLSPTSIAFGDQAVGTTSAARS